MNPLFTTLRRRLSRLLVPSSPMFLWLYLGLAFLVVHKGLSVAERKFKIHMATTESESRVEFWHHITTNHLENAIAAATYVPSASESSDQDKEAERRGDIVCPTYVPHDPAILAAMLRCCDLHDTLSAAGSPAFFNYIDIRSPSTSLYDIFDNSPMPSCQKAYLLSSLAEQDIDEYVQRYQSPEAYRYLYTSPPPDYQTYILRKYKCLSDMILWFGGRKMSDGSQIPHDEPVDGGRKSDRITPKTSLMLDLLFQAGDFEMDRNMRSVYGEWILPHVRAAKRWEEAHMKDCWKTKATNHAVGRDRSQISGWRAHIPIQMSFSIEFGYGGQDIDQGHGVHEKHAWEDKEACLLEKYGSAEQITALWDKYKLQGSLDRDAVCRTAKNMDIRCLVPAP